MLVILGNYQYSNELQNLWHCGEMVTAAVKLHSTNLELRFCADSNPASGALEIGEGENLLQWFLLEIRLNAFHRPTFPQKQLIIIIIIAVSLENPNNKLVIRKNCP